MINRGCFAPTNGGRLELIIIYQCKAPSYLSFLLCFDSKKHPPFVIFICYCRLLVQNALPICHFCYVLTVQSALRLSFLFVISVCHFRLSFPFVISVCHFRLSFPFVISVMF